MTVCKNAGKSNDRGLSCFVIGSQLIKGTFYQAARIACVGAAMLGGAAESARAQTPPAMSAADTCLAANSSLSLGAKLPRTTARLKSGEPLKIVAIGSSSTVGLWVLQSAATYPEVMRRELLRIKSNAEIQIINSGRVGDTIPDNIARFERDVFSYGPDLVVWQLGTNDIAWGGHLDDQLKSIIVQGVRAKGEWDRCDPDGLAIRADGAEVCLLFQDGGNYQRGCSAGTGRPVFSVRANAQVN